MVETNITKRWEKGYDHHPESEKIARAIGKLDFEYGEDFFCFKFGGDGDNGEHLMYLLDIYFEQLDEQNDKCLNPKCVCHTNEKHKIVTPFPLEFGPIYCCNRCASSRKWIK